MSILEATAPRIAPQSPVKEVTTRDVLHRAADLLSEFGWCQHNLGSREQGHFCALGAINQASADLGVPGATNSYGLAHSGAFMAFKGLGDIDWNNAPGRTREEVIAALRAAAEASV